MENGEIVVSKPMKFPGNGVMKTAMVSAMRRYQGIQTTPRCATCTGWLTAKLSLPKSLDLQFE